MKFKKRKVIILGGGLAGLACADEILQKAGDKFEVLVLEKQNYLGGLATTHKKDGFYFDLAPHRWFTKNDELNQWLDELMGPEIIWVKKNTPMYQFGKFFDYPVRISDVLKKISPFKTLVMVLTYLWARLSKLVIGKRAKTMKEAYVSRFGYALYKWFNQEYNAKLWGEDFSEKMSADFVEQRTKDLSVTAIIKQALGLEKKVISLTPRFKFPKLGVGQISKNLEKRIKKNQGEIITKVIIKKVIKNRKGFVVQTNQREFSADWLVSSIPIDELTKLISPAAPPRIIKNLEKLNYIHQKIVILMANKSRLTRFTWVYIHPREIKAFRFLETNNWSSFMSPKGKTSLVFEYPYQPGDEIETLTDQELVKITVDDFIQYFSPQTKPSDIIKSLVFSVPKAYPKYDLNYRLPLSRIKKYLANKYPRLQLIGRNGRFRYNNMDHSIYTGLLAARNIVSGKKVFKLERVNNEAAYIEEKMIK